MNIIYNEYLSAVSVAWTIEKAQSGVPENFFGTRMSLILEHSTAGRFPVAPISIENGTLSFVLPDGLPVGIYGMKAVWTKDEGVSISPKENRRFIKGERGEGVYNRYSVCEVASVFCVTDIEEESTIDSNGGTIKIRSKVATYGRDGLDAYERALMLGETTLSEVAWINTINFRFVGRKCYLGGSGTLSQ